jgi:alkyldihydroxyacetonephosphate synthase
MTDSLAEFASSFGRSASRRGDGLVFRPESRDEAARGVRLARGLGLGLQAAPSVGDVHLDLSGLDRVLEIDERSRLVHVEVGISIDAVESRLSALGSSLMTAASPALTVGQYLASGCAGARSVDDDPVSQAVAGLEAVALDGRVLQIRPAPRRAVGPDLINAILASGWSIAIPLSVHLVARPARSLHALGYRFESRDEAERALAWIRGRGARPAHTRLLLDGEGALLSLWLEAGPLLSPMQAIVTQEAKARGAKVAEPADYAAETATVRPSPALAAFEASLRAAPSER